jgi:hypothetical protein
MQFFKKNSLFVLGWLGFILVWFCFSNEPHAGTDTVSSCVACHTHYGKLKKSLSKNKTEISPLIEGMG